MAATRASLLHHGGRGVAAHCDLILGSGRTCPTLSLAVRAGRLAARWLPAHRRRYLAFRGPVPGGRGRVAQLASAPVRWWRHAAGAVLVLPSGRLRIANDRVVVLEHATTVGSWTAVARRTIWRRQRPATPSAMSCAIASCMKRPSKRP